MHVKVLVLVGIATVDSIKYIRFRAIMYLLSVLFCPEAKERTIQWHVCRTVVAVDFVTTLSFTYIITLHNDQNLYKANTNEH